MNNFIRQLTTSKFRLRYFFTLLLSSLSGFFDFVTTATVFLALSVIINPDSKTVGFDSTILNDLSPKILFGALIFFVILSGVTRVLALRNTLLLSFDFSMHLLLLKLRHILTHAPVHPHAFRNDSLQSLFTGKANSFCTDFVFSVLYVPVAILNILFIVFSLFFIGTPSVFIIFCIISSSYIIFALFQRKKIRHYSSFNSALQNDQSSLLEKISVVGADIKLHNLYDKYLTTFESININLRKNQANIMFFNGMPRPTIETIGMLVLLLAAYVSYETDNFNGLFTIPIIGYVGLKLLPLVQSVFQCYTLSRASYPIAIQLLSLDEVKFTNSIPDQYFILSNNLLKFRNSLNATSFKTLTVGDVLSIYGPSGVGKTTQLFLLVGNLFKSHSVCLVGQRGYVFNSTIRENLLLLTKKYYDDEYLVDIVNKFGLTFIGCVDDLDIKIGTHGRILSGGEVQRLAICRAILAEPDFLILDEPTSSLNSDLSKYIMDCIRDLCKERILIFVTHDLSIIKHTDLRLSMSSN